MPTFPAPRALFPQADVQFDRDPRSAPLETPQESPFTWARRRRAEREARRVEAASSRALQRLAHLGPAWHVVQWPHADLGGGYDAAAQQDRAGFLAIGPSGVYAVTVADHGRSRVLIAGDVVQINGRRPAYIAEARREARRASRALSAAVGRTVPVFPVLAFVGSGAISAHGLPRDCLVASHRELDRLLVAGGTRISATTAKKLFDVARHPQTWSPPGRQGTAEDYRWYAAGRSALDKPAR